MSFLIFFVGLPVYLASVVSLGTGLTLFENGINSITGLIANTLAGFRILVPV